MRHRDLLPPGVCHWHVKGVLSRKGEQLERAQSGGGGRGMDDLILGSLYRSCVCVHLHGHVCAFSL